MSYDIVIIGAGPAGLACSRVAAENGLKVLVVERNQSIGRKVCAGGITWNGLMKKIPGYVAEKEFSRQYVYSPFQKVVVTSKTPIIATVDRVKLGLYMAETAIRSGVEIRTSCQVRRIDSETVTVLNRESGHVEKVKYRFLVGADGSSSLVRRYLDISCSLVGVGINYMVPGELEKMQWHFNSALFRNGYCWIFPHAKTVSVGAYVCKNGIKPTILKQNLLKWAELNGFDLSGQKLTAEQINYDYRGCCFNNVFLAGDAAGLASGLTGEGIYPAIVSGEAVAGYIVSPDKPQEEMARLVAAHKKHKRMTFITARSRFLALFLSELIIFGLRTGVVQFDKIEMAN